MNFNIPILALGDIIHARRHNKSIREVYCQNLIERERLHFLSKSHYHQSRLDRNVKKYKDKQKTRYKRRIERHWAKVKKRQEYQDLLYTTSRAIDNKVVNKYEQINQVTEECDVPMNELHTDIKDKQEQDTLKHELTETDNKTEINNNQETQQKLKEKIDGANKSFNENEKKLKNSTLPERC